MKTYVVEDDTFVRDLLTSYLAEFYPGVESQRSNVESLIVTVNVAFHLIA